MARSGTEQAADLAKLFALLKKYEVTTTTPEMAPLKRDLIDAMNDLKGVVCLPASHLAALIDFLASLPGILQKIATRTIIRQGFVEAGVIDDVSHSVPDIAAIIRTTRRQLSLEEEQNFIEQFPKLLNVFLQDGNLTDDVIEQHGIPIDIDAKGNEVRRDSTISGESFQRAKCLTHKTQRRLRQELNDGIIAKQNDKEAKVTLEKEQTYVRNKECEKAMRKRLKQPEDELSLQEATLDMFAKSNCSLLRAFCQVRKGKPESGWPKKGSVTDAETGVANLISLAFGCRCDSILVEVSEGEEERPSVRDVASVPFQTVRIAPLHLALCRFVVTEEWIKDVKMAFNPEQMVHFESYSSTEMQPKVDVLVKILWSRLQNHIRSRVDDKSKHRSWVWNFVRENLGRVAAVMILARHVRDNLLGVVSKNNVCLLRSPYKGSKMVPLTAEKTESDPMPPKLYKDVTFTLILRPGPGFAVARQQDSPLRNDLSNTTKVQSYLTTKAWSRSFTQHFRVGMLRSIHL